MCDITLPNGKRLTCRQMVLLQLSKFTCDGSEMIMPFGTCQDGIGLALGITRSHASLELKKLVDSGSVDYHRAHIPSSKTQRMAYRLTMKGAFEAGEIKDLLRSVGIVDIDPLFENMISRNPIEAGFLYDAVHELEEAIDLLKTMQKGVNKPDFSSVNLHIINAMAAVNREDLL